MNKSDNSFIHSTAIVSDKAEIGSNVKIWHFSHVRENSHIGNNSIISQGVYIDFEVIIGKSCKIQNNVSIFHGVTIEDGVFVGPHVCFTNDKYPRAINEDGSLKNGGDWEVGSILVKTGASIGANSTILTGVTIGKFAVIGAGSVVTKDVPDFTLYFGNPAKLQGKISQNGRIIRRTSSTA